MSLCVRWEVLSERMTVRGLVVSAQDCGSSFVFCWTLFASLSRNGNKFDAAVLLDVWLQALPTSLHGYRGNLHVLARVDPKLLLPKRTCTQQAVFLIIGVERCLRLLMCSLSFDLDWPLHGTMATLVMVWFHRSWPTFGSI